MCDCRTENQHKAAPDLVQMAIVKSSPATAHQPKLKGDFDPQSPDRKRSDPPKQIAISARPAPEGAHSS
jgi:hypothetical protein